MNADLGKINYVSWCIAVGRRDTHNILKDWEGRRDTRKILKDWDEMPEAVQDAWRTAAETVIDEDWVASGGHRQKVTD